MKHRSLYLIIVSVVIVILVIPLILNAQPPDNRVPPPPKYMPGELPPGIERPEIPPDQRPTPTPSDIEAVNLPSIATPEKLPTFEMIDTAPDVPHENKYHVIIQRGKSGQKIAISVPIGIEKEEILNKYLNYEEGDQFLYISPPAFINKSDSFIK